MKKVKDNLTWKIDQLEAKLHGKEALAQSYRAKYAVAKQEKHGRQQLSADERQDLEKQLYELRKQLVAQKIHTQTRFVQRAVKKAVTAEQLKLKKKIATSTNEISKKEYKTKLDAIKADPVSKLTEQLITLTLKREFVNVDPPSTVATMLPGEWSSRVKQTNDEEDAPSISKAAPVFGALNEMATVIRVASGQITKMQLRSGNIEPNAEREKESDSDIEDNDELDTTTVIPPRKEERPATTGTPKDGYISGSEDEHRPQKKRTRPPRHIRAQKASADKDKWKYTPNAPPIQPPASTPKTFTKLHPSWEAKKRQAAPVKFAGKKKTF